MVQNPHSVQADTHDYFLPRPGRLSSKSGTDMIISCGDQRLVGSARQCPTLAVWALRLGGVVFQRLHQNSYPGRLVFSLLRRWGGVWVMFQKVVPAARWGGVPKVGVMLQKVVLESSIGWCSKSWGVPKSCPRMECSKSWGGIPKSCPRILDGVVFQKLGWCSKNCPRIPTLYTTEDVHMIFSIFYKITSFST